ncbi:MAG: hypothetical protein J0L51_07260 [Rhizobiales bacterium]|nr:hypothetical protein [Hyphomicrobiales bacterium]
MNLPANMDSPAVEATIENAKQAFGSFAIDCVLDGQRAGGSALGLGAIAMMGLLDAACEHFVVWHRAQSLPFEEAAFLGLVTKRLALAKASDAVREAGPNMRVVQ